MPPNENQNRHERRAAEAAQKPKPVEPLDKQLRKLQTRQDDYLRHANKKPPGDNNLFLRLETGEEEEYQLFLGPKIALTTDDESEIEAGKHHLCTYLAEPNKFGQRVAVIRYPLVNLKSEIDRLWKAKRMGADRRSR